MRVAVDARPLTSGDSVRGIGVYTRELLGAFAALKKDITVLENGFDNKDLGKYDVVHFTSFNPFVISVPVVKPKGTKFVLTIYDLIPLIYPDHYPPGIKGAIKLAVNKYLIKKNIDAILTISETSKKDICRFFGISPKVVHVIYLAPPKIFKKIKELPKPNLPKGFALYVGDLNYNKNIPVLFRACALAGIRLVIAGKQAGEIEGLDLGHPELKHLRDLDWSNVTRLGYISDAELVSVYNLATVYIQPSLYEGFGLPLLEAFACGVPAVASKTQALVEIGEGAALFANPKDPGDFAGKIKFVVDNKELADDLVKKGLAKAKEFSWERTAKKTFEVYEKL